MKRNFLKKGLTLSELLLAVLFVVCVIVLMMQSFITCVFLNETNRDRMIAASHAQYVMEEIKGKATTISGFKDLTSTYVNANWDLPNTSAINAKGLMALKGESIDASASGTTLLDVKVTVNWYDRSNRNRSVILETLMVEP
ncbi:MAG: hypothetical protein WCY05_08340 [Candidatus Omnitrophota bacterium]